MRLRLAKLLELEEEAQKIRAKMLKKDFKKEDKVLQHQKLPFLLDVIKIKLINRLHNNLLVDNFSIDKIKELIS